MHTPGPWKIDFETGELSTSDVVIGTIYGVEYLNACPDVETAQEIEDTAILIQHAPELLDACRNAAVILAGDPCQESVLDVACKLAAASAKASGHNIGELMPGVMGPDKKADMLT